MSTFETGFSETPPRVERSKRTGRRRARTCSPSGIESGSRRTARSPSIVTILDSVRALEVMGISKGIIPLHGIVKAWRVWLVAHVEEGSERDLLLETLNKLTKRSRAATKRKPRPKKR